MMKWNILICICVCFFVTGCATKSKFVYDHSLVPPGNSKGTIVAALAPIIDERFDGKEIDSHYEGDPLKDIQSMLDYELMSTDLFSKVLPVSEISNGSKADMIIEPSLTKLAWEVPDYASLLAKGFLFSFLTGIVGGVIYGVTTTDVYGESGIHLLVKDSVSGKTLLDKNYSSRHEEELTKFSCDTSETKVMMAGKSLQKTMAAIKSDLIATLGTPKAEQALLPQQKN